MLSLGILLHCSHMEITTSSNPNSNLDPQNEMHRLAHMDAQEGDFYGCASNDETDADEADGCGDEDKYLDSYWEDQHEMGMMGDF